MPRTKASKTSLPFKPVGPPRVEMASKPAAPAAAKPAATIADVKIHYKAPARKSASNALNAAGTATQSLQMFTLAELAQFTKESTYSTNASKDVHLFYRRTRRRA